MTVPRKVYSEERWREQDAWDQGYEAGLRRAQELAHRYAGLDFDEVGFDRDIDAEAAKERT